MGDFSYNVTKHESRVDPVSETQDFLSTPATLTCLNSFKRQLSGMLRQTCWWQVQCVCHTVSLNLGSQVWPLWICPNQFRGTKLSWLPWPWAMFESVWYLIQHMSGSGGNLTSTSPHSTSWFFYHRRQRIAENSTNSAWRYSEALLVQRFK